ncbi:MAG: hypothetical protein HYS18_02960 [Burkholderiales bacterium]|nr:hypothetical protein [Burkholderiales bacterium]
MRSILSIMFAVAGAVALPAIAGTELNANAAAASTATGAKGVALVPPPSNMGAVAPSEQASTVRGTKRVGQTLRCWQHGRLLYEGTGFRADAEKRPNAVTMQRTDGESVVVYDQKDSICILSNK